VSNFHRIYPCLNRLDTSRSTIIQLPQPGLQTFESYHESYHVVDIPDSCWWKLAIDARSVSLTRVALYSHSPTSWSLTTSYFLVSSGSSCTTCATYVVRAKCERFRQRTTLRTQIPSRTLSFHFSSPRCISKLARTRTWCYEVSTMCELLPESTSRCSRARGPPPGRQNVSGWRFVFLHSEQVTVRRCPGLRTSELSFEWATSQQSGNGG